jgi:signal transduction histidine kinase
MTAGATPDLAALLDRIRAAGQVLTVDADDVASLEPELRGTVHRIVQEALTNVLRHAPGATAAVTVRRTGPDVCVAVSNGAAAAPGGGPGSGRGLEGLRERVALRDGELRWGPCADGGFQVRAVLPLRVLEEAGR